MTEQRLLGRIGLDWWHGRIVLGGFALGSVLTLAPSAAALPGTHPAAISTFDTRASSVVLAYRRGVIGGGGSNQVSYNANFTNTSGVLSSQFGLHYVNFKAGTGQPSTNGVAGGAVGLINIPVAHRLDNGLPSVAIGPYFGIMPTALISGEKNYLSLPFIIGISVPWSPVEALTLTPWYELAVSVDLDTVVKPAAFSGSVCDFIACDAGIPLPNQDSVTLDTDTVGKVLDKGVDVDLTVSVPMRVGFDAAVHLSDATDFNVTTGLITIGGGFGGVKEGFFGASLVWRWDDIVPAVLPPEKRLLREDCADIEARFRTCPASRNWKSPEQLMEPSVAPTPPPAPVQGASPTAPADSYAPSPEPPAATESVPPPAAPLPAPASPAPEGPPTAGFPE